VRPLRLDQEKRVVSAVAARVNAAAWAGTSQRSRSTPVPFSGAGNALAQNFLED
jgi:hypothetical protein